MTYLSCVGVETCRAGALLQRRSIERRVEKCESRIFHSFFSSREEQKMVNLLDQLRKIKFFLSPLCGTGWKP